MCAHLCVCVPVWMCRCVDVLMCACLRARLRARLRACVHVVSVPRYANQIKSIDLPTSIPCTAYHLGVHPALL